MFNPGEPDIVLINTNEESIITEVSLTVYLDDNVPPAGQRALNLHLAQMGFDFFEVVFKYDTNIARTSWELGQAAGVSGVSRTDAGINYASVNPNRDPADGGSAILFVGNKFDKTLLAIGTISHVDGVGGAIITSESKSVTFTVSALEAAVNVIVNNSSFLTSANNGDSIETWRNNTAIDRKIIGPHTFPWYILQSGVSSILARYTFTMHSDNLDNYTQAILQAGAIIIEKNIPTYTANSGIVYSTGSDGLDDTTVITPLNNTTPDNPFENPVLFTFNTTSTANGALFSFVFSVPVYALSSFTGGDSPITWYVRPGFGQYLHDLDTGTGSGGGILVGTASDPSVVVPPSGEYRLSVTKPSQGQYADTSVPVDISDVIPTLVRGSTQWSIYDDLNNALITVTIEGVEVTNYDSFDLTLVFLTHTGLVEVVVTYDLTNGDPYTPDLPNDALGEVYTTVFHIFIGDTTNIIYRLVGDTGTEGWEALGYFNATTAGPGTVLVMVIMNPVFDLAGYSLNGQGKTLVVVAGVPNVVIGRGTDGGGRFIPDNDDTATFYFGEWPFLDGLYVSIPITTYPFTLNTGGPAADVTDDTASGTFIATRNGNADNIRIYRGDAVTTTNEAKLVGYY